MKNAASVEAVSWFFKYVRHPKSSLRFLPDGCDKLIVSSYPLCTLETSQSDATPSEALAYVASIRNRSDPDAFVFGGNLIVRDISYTHDSVVEHACERLDIPRYAFYSYNDTSVAGNARLFEQDNHGTWQEICKIEAWHESWDSDDDPLEYIPASGDEVPPNPELTMWESEHPAAALQHKYDFDTVGNYTATVRDEQAGVVTECPEPTVSNNVHADATYHAVWQYYDNTDVPPSANSRLTDAYEAASGYRGVTVDEVTVDDRCVAVTLSAPVTLSPRKAAYFLGWRTHDAYREHWGTGSGPPTGRPNGVTSADVSRGTAIEAVQQAESRVRPAEDISVSIAWTTPSCADSGKVAERVAAAVNQWAFCDHETQVYDEMIYVTVQVDGSWSPWLVAHLIRDALQGDGHPTDPVGFGSRPVTVSTVGKSVEIHSDIFKE